MLHGRLLFAVLRKKLKFKKLEFLNGKFLGFFGNCEITFSLLDRYPSGFRTVFRVFSGLLDSIESAFWFMYLATSGDEVVSEIVLVVEAAEVVLLLFAVEVVLLE